MNKTIIGYETEKEQLNQLCKMLACSDEYRKKGIRIPRGLLLCGEPGVGKTVLAKSLSADGVQFIELSEFISGEDNLSSEIRNAFREAREKAPSILLIDELDILAGSAESNSAVSAASTRITLINELDSLSSEDSVLVVGTCNDKGSLGEEMLRPGRFDRVITIQTPDEKTRLEIIRYYFDMMGIEKRVDYSFLAKISSGFSGAGLECLANEVGIIALEKETPVITTEDVQNVMTRMFFSANASENTMSDEDKRFVAVHEAGHCMVTMLLRPDDTIGVTIRPQGGSGGHSSSVAKENCVITKTMAEDELAELIAGHVAERVICGEYTLGASSDLREAKAKINYLITCSGIYGYKYLGHSDLIKRMESSDGIISEIEELAESIFLRIDSRVESLITENLRLFNSIVDALLLKQSLSREELEQILSDYRARNAA